MAAVSSEKKYPCRSGSRADAAAIKNLMQQAFANYGKIDSQNKKIVNSALAEDLTDIINDLANNIVLVLLADEKIVASLRLEEISQQRFLLKRFAVHPDYQNQGLGTMLFTKAIARLKSENAHYLQLYSSLENKKLINFYRGLGFNCLEVDSKKGYTRGLWVKTIK
jgi:ribosomal protein S18 acetylase RimI-like enzyme